MSAIGEQSTTQPIGKTTVAGDMSPKAIVNHRARVIAIEVVVAQLAGASTPTISVPLVTIFYQETWTLFWELRVLTGGLTAQFADPGIVLPKTFPPGITRLNGPIGSEGLWIVQLENKVTTGSSFNYEIVIKSAAWTRKVQGQVDLYNGPPPVDFTKVPDPVDPPHLL